ncbi:MAG: aldo/keto reductase [Blautia sp.]|jgi:diketogulonate reductase-like aldo/keto reductase
MLGTSAPLNTNENMPLLGLGVYKATGENEVENAIAAAVSCGYRLIDTASVYTNEDGVGRGIARCGIPREELFITTKIWNNAQRLGDVEGAFNRSLDRLKLDYVDLYLIHWPVPGCYLSTWKELEKIYASGRAKSIGVSNFEPRHFEELAKVSDLVPAVNQIEFHPYYYQKETLEYCQSKGIQVQAYAPLARGAYLDNDIMCVLATKYGKTPAQIGLRWSLQKGVAVIPKSSQADRIKSNGEIFDFEIEPEDIAIIDQLNQNFRSANIPEDLRDIPF